LIVPPVVAIAIVVFGASKVADSLSVNQRAAIIILCTINIAASLVFWIFLRAHIDAGITTIWSWLAAHFWQTQPRNAVPQDISTYTA